jgi:hypothetical protein
VPFLYSSRLKITMKRRVPTLLRLFDGDLTQSEELLDASQRFTICAGLH